MPPAAALFVTVDPVFASSFVNVFADNGTGSYSTFSHLELSIPFVDSHTAARFDTVSPPPTTSPTSASRFRSTITSAQPTSMPTRCREDKSTSASTKQRSTWFRVCIRGRIPQEARLHVGVELRDRVSDEILYTTFLERSSTSDETHEIRNEERAAAVHRSLSREAQEVAESDRVACQCENQSDARRPVFARRHCHRAVPWLSPGAARRRFDAVAFEGKDGAPRSACRNPSIHSMIGDAM